MRFWREAISIFSRRGRLRLVFSAQLGYRATRIRWRGLVIRRWLRSLFLFPPSRLFLRRKRRTESQDGAIATNSAASASFASLKRIWKGGCYVWLGSIDSRWRSAYLCRVCLVRANQTRLDAGHYYPVRSLGFASRSYPVCVWLVGRPMSADCGMGRDRESGGRNESTRSAERKLQSCHADVSVASD